MTQRIHIFNLSSENQNKRFRAMIQRGEGFDGRIILPDYLFFENKNYQALCSVIANHSLAVYLTKTDKGLKCVIKDGKKHVLHIKFTSSQYNVFFEKSLLKISQYVRTKLATKLEKFLAIKPEGTGPHKL